MLTKKVIVCLACVYLIWGTSYVANHYALTGFPPFLLTGIRFFTAGALLLLGRRIPPARSILAAGLVGVLLLAFASGSLVYAQQSVPSSLAAIFKASVGLWTCIFGSLWGSHIRRWEWLGVGLGLAGVGVLNLDGNLLGSPIGALALMLGTMCWGLGTVLTPRLPMPLDSATSTGWQMLLGGAVLLGMAACSGERLVALPPARAWMALAYLTIMASLVTFSAYSYLLNHVRPSLATSYAYVNPLIAAFLGWWLVGESISGHALGGLALVLLALYLVTRSKAPDG